MNSQEEQKKTEETPTIHFKTLLCQLNPKYKEVEYNLKRAEVSLSKYSKDDQLDVILFAEMAFTGYIFENRDDIRPLCEEAGKGKIFAFCSNLAQRLSCYVMCGYPEIYFEKENKKEHFYNSLYVIDREGKLYHNYRKHFLYENDHAWAEEGPSFQAIELTNSEGVKFKAALAICMDINPYEFKDSSKFELAEFCKKENIDALFFSCAWIDDEPEVQGKEAVGKHIRYWLYRLYPLMADEKDSTRYKKKWVLFCTNRVGKEKNTTFCGSSCCVRVNPLQLVGSLDKKSEGFFLADINL